MQRLRDVVMGWSWLAVLAGLVAIVAWSGGEQLSPPATMDTAVWRNWVETRDAAQLVVAAARIASLVLGGYLWVVTLLSVVARTVGSVPLSQLARAVTLPSLRPLVHASIGLGLTTASLVPSGLAGTARLVSLPAPVAVTARTTPPVPFPLGGEEPEVVEPSEQRHAAPRPGGRIDDPDPLWHLLEVQPSAARTHAPPSALAPTPVALDPTLDGRHDVPAAPSPDAPPPPPPTAALPPAEARRPTRVAWVVEPGQHLWLIARAVTSEQLGRPAHDGEIAPYWRRLIAANHDRLVDRADPDLVHPGQRLILPPPA